jgi:hypothetical protein
MAGMEKDGVVRIMVEGAEKIYIIPVLALETSEPLYAMATSQMKEGVSKEIILKEDSPLALHFYVQLSMLHINEAKYTDFNMRVLELDELLECMEFADKYRAYDFKDRLIENVVQSPFNLHKFIAIDRKWEHNWNRLIIAKMASADELEDNLEKISTETLRKITAELLQQERANCNWKRKRMDSSPYPSPSASELFST